MNTDEKKLLSDFLDQLKSVRGLEKDQEAASMIEAAAREQPDASYLLVQKNLLQDQALNAARAEISALRRELEGLKQPQGRSGGFLSGNPWSAAPAPRSNQGYQAAPAPMAPAPSGALGSGGFGSFLGSAAATAAGVAGGAFLFQGIESLMGHHGGGYGFNDTGFQGEHGAENITVNEYYGDSASPGFSDASYDRDLPSDVSDQDQWDTYDDQSDSIDI